MAKQFKETNTDKLSFNWGTISNIGISREENQDAWFADPESGLFLVSDGMGGLQAGAFASKIVAEVLPVMVKDEMSKLRSRGIAAVKSLLNKTIIELSRRMRIESSNQTGMRGMGATLVMALLRDDRAYIANVGDSRAYLFRKGKFRQLSEDHSIVALLLRSGEITPEEAEFHPARGQLSRYIGMSEEVYPYVCTITLKKEDRLLLCSDGLTGVINDDVIASILQEHLNPQDTCQKLIAAANSKGGPDNITVAVIDCLDP